MRSGRHTHRKQPQTNGHATRQCATSAAGSGRNRPGEIQKGEKIDLCFVIETVVEDKCGVGGDLITL